LSNFGGFSCTLIGPGRISNSSESLWKMSDLAMLSALLVVKSAIPPRTAQDQSGVFILIARAISH
jgi:hypothetical protein